MMTQSQAPPQPPAAAPTFGRSGTISGGTQRRTARSNVKIGEMLINDRSSHRSGPGGEPPRREPGGGREPSGHRASQLMEPSRPSGEPTLASRSSHHSSHHRQSTLEPPRQPETSHKGKGRREGLRQRALSIRGSMHSSDGNEESMRALLMPPALTSTSTSGSVTSVLFGKKRNTGSLEDSIATTASFLHRQSHMDMMEDSFALDSNSLHQLTISGPGSLLNNRTVSGLSTASTSSHSRNNNVPPSTMAREPEIVVAGTPVVQGQPIVQPQPPQQVATLAHPRQQHHTIEELALQAQSASNCDATDNGTYEMEIAPGYYVPFRSANEVWQAVANRHILACICMECCVELVCVADCEHVVCPDCSMVNPIFDRPEFVTTPIYGAGMGLKKEWIGQ